MKDATHNAATVEFRKLRQFVKRLTPKEREKLKVLRKTVWWWWRKEFRRADKDNPARGIPFDFSDNGAKRICRNYELARRAPNKKGEKAMFARSYLDLSRDERTMCCSLWIPPSEAPTRYAMNSSQQSEPGWFAFDHRIQWNLSASPAALQKYFIEQIKLACLIQKFQSKKTNEGKQNAPATWDYIEILDRKKNRIGLPLNDSEKQKVKDGMKLAKKFHEEYRQALKDWLKNTDSSDTEEPNDVEE